MKKKVSLVLAAALLAGSMLSMPVSASAAAGFSDVPKGQFYTEAVSWAVDKGITTGTGNNQFSPDDKCTRAQIVTFLHRAMTGAASSEPAETPEPSDVIEEFNGRPYSELTWQDLRTVAVLTMYKLCAPSSTVTQKEYLRLSPGCTLSARRVRVWSPEL